MPVLAARRGDLDEQWNRRSGLRLLRPVSPRLILGAAVLFVIAGVQRSPLPRSPALWGHMTVAALFGNAAPYLLFALGEQRVSSSTAGILNATTPLWTLLVAMATRHERTVTPARVTGLVVGFGGALLIFSPWHAGSELASAGGLECLGAAVSYGIAFVYMDRFIARSGVSPVVLSAGQLLIAVLGEHISLPVLAGIALILSGVALVRTTRR